MADPFTILGAASSIITLLEFSWKLLADTRTIYKSGTSENEENSFLSHIAEDVRRLGDAIVVSPECEDDLQTLVNEAQGVARDLVEALDKLKVQGTKTVWKSFVVALKDVWKSGQIEAFSHRLAKLQTQIASHIQLLILHSVTETSRRLENTNKELETTIQTEFKNLREEIIDAAVKLELEESSHTTSLKKELKVRKNTETLNKEFVGGISADLRDLSGKVSHLRESGKTTVAAQRVLKSLYFSGIRTRQRKIPDAHAETFTWIFQRRLPDSNEPIHFVDWLRGPSVIFWIQGKPGSGKSTLMKFLSYHGDVRFHLKSWAGNKQLLVASFFFWHAGSPLQKSQKGLLRSLLFELLRHRPDLIPRVHALRAELDIDWDENWSWTSDELLYVFRNLIVECSGTEFCFFIDGLDEYEEDQMDPSNLVKSIQSLASLPNIKLCVSSRPWSVFADGFGRDLDMSLKLEDLTRSDIRRYVSDKFEEKCQLVNLPNKDLMVSKLINEVCKRAKGVFLWVYLVVKDLLDGVTNGDSLSFLMARMEKFPDDLEEFFRHMIDNIPTIYHPSTARMFDITKLASEPQSAIAFSFVDEVEAESEFAIQLPLEPMPDSEIVRREEQIRRRLDARSKGLLEITSDGGKGHPFFHLRVDFLHRTVREFLLRPDGLSLFLHQHLANRRTALIMCSAIVSTLKRSPDTPFRDWSEIRQLIRCLFDWVVEAEQNADTLDELIEILKSAELTYDALAIQIPPTGETPDGPFLGLACERNIVSFVQARLRNSPTLANMNNIKRPLLDFALNGKRSSSNSELIKILLDNGADPNQYYASKTVWTRFTSRIQRENRPKSDEYIKDMIDLLVCHGANFESLSETKNELVSGLQRQDCLYGEAAWRNHGPIPMMKPSSEVVKAWFTKDEYAALLRTSKAAKPGGMTSIRAIRNRMLVKREEGSV